MAHNLSSQPKRPRLQRNTIEDKFREMNTYGLFYHSQIRVSMLYFDPELPRKPECGVALVLAGDQELNSKRQHLFFFWISTLRLVQPRGGISAHYQDMGGTSAM